MKHEQPAIHPATLQRLHFIAACYEMEPGRMLNLIVAISLEELDGMQDELTVCTPVDHLSE